MTGLGKIVRALAGLVVLVVLLVTVNGYYGQYKQAARAKSSASAASSSSVDATRVVPVVGSKKVVVLVDGIVLRATPAANGATVLTLKKGQQLILVGTTVNSWLQLRDSANGKIGYAASDTSKLQVQK